VTHVSSLAIPAFLESAVSTLTLQADILSGCVSSDDSYFQAYLPLWSTTFVTFQISYHLNSRSGTALVFKLISSG